jgi:hypothetical protein
MHNEQIYLHKFLEPLKRCKQYQPKFGRGNKEEGLSLTQFLELYETDSFYSWCGLNSDLMYAAHKAAGGMTSIYRQLGKGCEYLFREIIIDATEYESRKFAEWSYTTQTRAGKNKTLSLDGCLALAKIQNMTVKDNVSRWLTEYSNTLTAEPPKHGAVFEVRQGYKSKDSKRQNADLDNITVAWSQGYLPVFAVFSGQIDSDLRLRYRNSRGGILTGTLLGNSQDSLFIFCKEVLGYDLADFFKRHSVHIKQEMHDTLEILLNV